MEKVIDFGSKEDCCRLLCDQKVPRSFVHHFTHPLSKTWANRFKNPSSTLESCNVISFVWTAFFKASEDREWLWLWSRERLDRCFLQASCFKQYSEPPSGMQPNMFFTLLITNSHGHLWHGITVTSALCLARCCHPWDSPLAQISWTCRKGHGKIWQAYSVRQAYPFESWKFILDREHPVTSWTRWRILQQSRNWITIRDDGWKDSPESTSWEGLRFLRAMAPNGRCFKQVPVRC